MRLLQYAKESNNLLFTTTLQNSVQSYSLDDSRLLDISNNHPTPPSVFAISCNSQFLVSTSAAPPTIYLTDLRLNTVPILVRPECSSAAVVAAAFHPDIPSRFILAFADGTTAVLDASHYFRKQSKKSHGARAAGSDVGGVLAFIKGLHAQGTSTGKEALESGISRDGLDVETGIIGIGDKSWGITAAAFVPGRKALVITVGADGKCCVVDFTQDSKEKAVLLRTWHLRRPATSLSVVCARQDMLPDQKDGTNDASPSNSHASPNEAYYIAIGRQDGRVLVFDLDGKLLGEQAVNDNGGPIVDVEWTQSNGPERGVSRRNSSPALSELHGIDTDSCEHAPSNHEPAATVGLAVKTSKARQDHRDLPHAPLQQSTLEVSAREGPPNSSIEAPNHLDLVQHQEWSILGMSTSNLTTPSSDLTTTSPSTKTRRRNTPLDSALKSHLTAVLNGQPAEDGTPPVPPRPSPRPGGLLSLRRAQSSREGTHDSSYSTMIAKARRTKSNTHSGKTSLFGPRPVPGLGKKTSKIGTVSGDARPLVGEAEWERPPTPPPHGRVLKESPVGSTESFRTASSHLDSSDPSERSTDTVIDWDIGAIRQPVPSLEEGFQQAVNESTPSKPRQKGHVSLSVSSISQNLDTAAPTSSGFSDVASPIIQWSDASPRYSAPGLHAAQRPVESPAKGKKKQKGHVSIPISSASEPSVTPVSSASSGPVVQWPSLKKSPRVTGLNTVLEPDGPDVTSRPILEASTEGPAILRPTTSGFDSHEIKRREKQSESNVSTTRLEATINVCLSVFGEEMSRKFEEQRRWLEGLIKSENEGRIELEEENRFLKAKVEMLKEGKHGEAFDEWYEMEK